jgi:hypothetical protein
VMQTSKPAYGRLLVEAESGILDAISGFENRIIPIQCIQ